VVLDSSAVLAILFQEKGYERFIAALREAELVAIGAPTLLEATMVSTRIFDLQGRSLVAQLLASWNVIVTPFDVRHARVATDAFLRFGKGRHPAALNFGDCMTYATAQVAGLPLLFAGEDFAQTDIEAA
jgi:ribonuclease VapC